MKKFMIVEKGNLMRVASILAVSFVIIAGFSVWQSPNSAAAINNANRPTFKSSAVGNFNIKFDYSKAEEPGLFTDKVKAEIEESARFLESYIANSHEIMIDVVSSEKLGRTYATAGPSAWQESTEENPIEKPFVTRGGIQFNAATLRKNDGSNSMALTIHELMHALGFTSGHKPFAAHVKNGQFNGPTALKMNGGKPVPLAADGSHFLMTFKDPLGAGGRMNASGQGLLLSAMDLAVLADIGYDIPALEGASGPMFVGYKLDSKYGKSAGDNDYLLDGAGGNDILYAGKGNFNIRGAGGDDILVSGDGDTEMDGDDDPEMPPPYRSGKDGKDTFVIRDNKHTYRVKDLDANDVILISPSVGVTKEEIDEAMKDPTKFINMPVPGSPNSFVPGVWQLTVGEFKIGIGTKDGKKPTSLDNIRIEDWSAN